MTDPVLIVRRHRRLERRRNLLQKWEMRVSMWMQLWAFFVLAAFVLKGAWQVFPWPAVAAVAGGQTILYITLYMTNLLRWHTERKRREIESSYQRAMEGQAHP